MQNFQWKHKANLRNVVEHDENEQEQELEVAAAAKETHQKQPKHMKTQKRGEVSGC